MPTQPYPTKSEDVLLFYTSNSDGVSFYVNCSKHPKELSPEWFFKSFPEVHTSYPAGGPVGVNRLVGEAEVDFGGEPAHEYRFSEHDGMTLHVIRVYFVGKYQYMLGVVSTPADKVDDADVQRFFSSFRQDTAQYMPRSFLRDLNAALDRQYPSMWMVGEVWSEDPIHTSYFIGGRTGWDGVDTKLDAVFDFPAWDVSRNVFTGKRPASDLRLILRADSLYPDPARLVTMANNHDTRRFMSLPGATLEGAMLHLAYTLTIRGTPQLYAGEEIAMEGGDDPDNRRDFPGGFAGDARNAFERSGRNPAEQRMYEWTRDLLRLRREHTALRRGVQLDLYSDDDSYAYARRDAQETVVIILNRAAASKELTVPASYLNLHEGARLEPLHGAVDRPTVAAGSLKLNVPAKSAVFYRLSAQ